MLPLLVLVEHREPSGGLVLADIAGEFGRGLEVDRHDMVVQMAEVGRGIRAELAPLDIFLHFISRMHLHLDTITTAMVATLRSRVA